MPIFIYFWHHIEKIGLEKDEKAKKQQKKTTKSMKEENGEKPAKKHSKLLYAFLTLVLIGIIGAIGAYNVIFGSNIQLPKGEERALRIYKGEQFDDVIAHLQKTGAVRSTESFIITAKLKRYPGHVKSGYYELKDGMSNFTLLRMLASGRQSPVKLTFNNIRTNEELAHRLSVVLEMDSLTAINMLTNKAELAKYGVDDKTVLALFIPNTYEMYWNITPDKLMDRMKKEYDGFWNASRKQKLQRTGLTPMQVSTLASIVEEETIKPDEQPVVAGLYINRYRIGMKLESDPTVKYALHNFTLKRIYTFQLGTDSPYNTYKYAGLPPGPIRIPSIGALDAVLNYKEHKFIYMCAKEDFSGYHNFAVTKAEHLENAKRYQQKLNELNIH